MIKKSVLFLTFCLVSSLSLAQQSDCNQEYSALLVSEKDHAILFEKRSDKISYPASLVKMMTVYLTFEALEHKHLTLEKILTVSARGEEIAQVNNGNTLHLKQGDKIKVKEAIQAVLVKSFNEAAVTLAEGVAGSEWEFIRKMNQKSLELGMYDTSFHNASGLHEVGQYTTAYDLARLALNLKKKFPQYYNFFGMKKFLYHGEKYVSHNHVLLEYKGAEGMKTGFTKASGFNLVSVAKKKNERIFSVVLGCPTAKTRDELTKDLFNIGFKKLHEKRGAEKLSKLNLNGFDYGNKDVKISKKEEKKEVVLKKEEEEKPEAKIAINKTENLEQNSSKNLKKEVIKADKKKAKDKKTRKNKKAKKAKTQKSKKKK